jgi:acyl-CoA reductase-like NAD-dependent aldehyde dehydrogenase
MEMSSRRAIYRLLINGHLEQVAKTYPIINPANEAVVGEAPNVGAAEAAQAARFAADAFPSWSRTAPEMRMAILNRAADLVGESAEELADLAQQESGCTKSLARSMHVGATVDRLRRYARGALEPTATGLAPQVPPRTSPNASSSLVGSVVLRQPVGVVACISPYNAPMPNCASKIGAALAMGNAVVVKPAPQNPLGVLKLCEIFQQAGVPAGVVNVVTESGFAAAQALVSSEHVDMVSFTGSTVVGQKIAAAASSSMKRLLLELGGKGNAIVFEDASLELAVTGIASTWSFYAGQICTAPTRVLAHRKIHDRLIEMLARAAASMTIGDPTSPDTVIGPLISADHRERVERDVDQAVREGASLCTTRGRPQTERGFYVRPSLLVDVRPKMRIASDEVFGPVVAVLPFEDESEAIHLANSTKYGLYDYVYSSNTARAFHVAKCLRSGGVGINTIQRHAEAPFGGFKMSGVGRDCGTYALHAYSELQGVVFPA